MDISRTTVTEMYDAARYKIADSIINGKTLLISGGNYQICGGSAAKCCRNHCRKVAEGHKTLRRKGAGNMRIAVTYENGKIFQHFGHTEQFKVYDIQDGKIISSQIIGTGSFGHGALAGFLKDNLVDALICGGIGSGAQNALAAAGVRLYGGVSGDADDAVNAFLANNLGYNPDVHCDHHGHGSDESVHNCSSHSCH